MEQTLLDLLSSIRAVRLERKTLEELINDLIEREKPAGYPTSTISGEKVQSNHTQSTAENVYLKMQKLIGELEIQKESLMGLEIEATQRIYKELKDPWERSFVVKRFFQNKPVREIIREFGISKSLFYKTYEKYFSSVDKKNKNGQKKQVKCDTI